MADPATSERKAEDFFDRYYAEKLWNWLPEVYRDADMHGLNGPVMRPLIEAIAGEAAVARRAIDRLWEDVLIDYADEWAIAYIGELIGARLLSSGNLRGRRTDVANTIMLRRRAGTMPALHHLIESITGWPGVVAEAWKRLGRDWHGLDDSPYPTPASLYATAQGGFANLRSVLACDRLDGAFDSMFHRPDFRRLAGSRGRYAVPKLNVHLFRRRALDLKESMGLQLEPGVFTFDPSGREVALFAGITPPDIGGWRAPKPWDMPIPITVSLFEQAPFKITASTNLAAVGPRMSALVGATIDGQRKLAELCRMDVGGPAVYPTPAAFQTLQAQTHDPECGKYQLYGTAVLVSSGANMGGVTTRRPEEVAAAQMPATAAVPPFPLGVEALIDPGRGIVRLKSDPVFRPGHSKYGCFWPIGAGCYSRSTKIDTTVVPVPATPANLDPIPLVVGPTQIAPKMLYPASVSWKLNDAVPDVEQLSWQAGDQVRPYVLLKSGVGARAVFAAKAHDLTKPADDPANYREIEIDGLWLNVAMASYPEQVLGSPDDSASPVMATILIDGTAAPFNKVILRNVTLDPGGERARVLPCRAVAIPYVRLLLKGEINELVIENSVTGPIEEAEPSDDPCSAGRVIIRDSIVQSIGRGRKAIDLKSAQLTIDRSTVLGAISADQLFASELLVTGQVVVADNQHGCFRFSAAGDDPAMRLPRQYESHLIAGGIAPHMFVSQRFGDAGYAQLSQTAPGAIQTGAENGSEIGAYSAALAPIKLNDLAAKLDEYAPFNTITGFVLES